MIFYFVTCILTLPSHILGLLGPILPLVPPGISILFPWAHSLDKTLNSTIILHHGLSVLGCW